MEIIIFFIIFIVIVVKNAGKSSQQTKPNVQRQPTVANQPRAQQTPNRYQTTASNMSYSQKSAAQLKEEIWNRLSEESKAKMLQSGNASTNTISKDGGSASQQVMQRRMEGQNTTILERAQDNNKTHAEDITLNTMEAEHNHSERIAPAVHNHPEDILSDNLLGTVEDLMIKGYDGTLCFERDFVGEALDMVNRFTVPGGK